MKNNTLMKLLVIPLLLGMMFSLIVVTPALADDGQPPVEPIAETTETLPAEVGDDETVEQPLLMEDAAPPEDLQEQAIEQPPLAEVLSAVPEGTEVVVVDESGEVVPLAAEEAAEIIEFAD